MSLIINDFYIEDKIGNFYLQAIRSTCNYLLFLSKTGKEVRKEEKDVLRQEKLL